jgi:hypothetical protein
MYNGGSLDVYGVLMLSNHWKKFNNEELSLELFEIVKQHSTGLLTDIELLLCCEKIKECYAQLDLSELCDPNTGLKFPKGYAPFKKD